MLKILFLVQDEQRAILNRLYDGVASVSDCDLRLLNKDQQKNLKDWFKAVDVHAYDYVLLMTRAKYAMKQTRFLRTLPNLAFLEHDAWQNYASCKYKGAFSKLYKQLPSCTVISSGFGVTRKLQHEGINAHFVPKGYDQELLSNLEQKRDIDCAFVGSIKNNIYKERSKFLARLSKADEVQLLQTSPGIDYFQTLNRIRFFISADIGFGEYMLKNFEAMACGCIVFAYNQGEQENHALGFRDMENIVLYQSQEELLSKRKALQQSAGLAANIRRAGQKLVESCYTFDSLGKRVIAVLETYHEQ